MNMQSNEKLSTKRTNPSSSQKSGPQKKKTGNITRSTPQFILPNPQQKTFKPPLQLQHTPQNPYQQQQNILLQPQQINVFPQKPSQEQYVPQQYESAPPNFSEIKESDDENAVLDSQPEKSNVLEQSLVEEKNNDGQDEDPDEKSGGWKNDEIMILLDYLQENFSSWSKGNKTKFYNNVAKNVLPNKEANAIKSWLLFVLKIKGKIARLISRYESIKKHNNQSGVERKDWYWYDKLDMIFGTRENITPSVIANKSTDIIEDEVTVKKESCKKLKGKNNVEVMSTAIVEMNQSRERIWEQRMKFEQEKLDKSHELEKERMKVEREKWAYEKEMAIAERERAKMEFELRMKELELRYQKRD